MGKLLANLNNKDRKFKCCIYKYVKKNKHRIKVQLSLQVTAFYISGTLPCHDTCMCPVVHLTGQQQGVAPETSLHGCFKCILFHRQRWSTFQISPDKLKLNELTEMTIIRLKREFLTFLRPNSSSSLKRSVSLPTFSGTVMKVSDRRESGPAPGSSSARASGSLLKSIKLASLGLLPGSQTERCSFSKRSAMSVPTTVLRKQVRKSMMMRKLFCANI